MKYIKIISLLLIMLSCSKENLSDGTGYLGFCFTRSDEILVTRSDADMIFAVKVIDQATGVTVKSVEDHRELEQSPLRLRAGKYRIVASSGADIDAAFDSPFYVGEQEIEVVSGKTAVANVVCSLSNVKVSVLVDESVMNNFTRYVVTVDNGEDGTLVFDQETSTLDKNGYFRCTGQLNWTIDLVNNNGTPFKFADHISDVKPREHYRLIFSIDEEGDKDTGGASLEITVDETTNDVQHDIQVPLDKKKQPVISGKDFDIQKNLTVVEASSVLGEVDIQSEAGAASIVISHDSEDLVALGIPGRFDILDIDPAVKEQVNGAGMTWGELASGANEAVIDFRTLISRLPLGNYAITISVLDSQKQLVDAVLDVTVIPDVEVTAVEVDAWARFADVKARYNTLQKPEGLGLKYRVRGSADWILIQDGFTVSEKGEISYRLQNLDPATDYEFCAVSAKDESNIIEFTTEAAAQLPNMNFDSWIKNGKEWYPNANLSDAYIWDTANKGANTLSEVNPTRPEETDLAVPGEGKKAIRMVSSSVLGIMAAGNVYSGQFVKTSGTSALLDWGRPFTSRPLSLKGYYKYMPKTIDKAKAPYEHMKGQMDICQIFVALMDWTAPYRINSGEANYINFETDPAVIGYGQLTDNVTMESYKEFTVDIEYRDSRKPKYIVLVCAASKYGDYFTGGIGSTLLVDELEFVY